MIGWILALLIQGYILVLFVRTILTWFPNIDRYNPLVKFIYDITEPVLRPVRQAIPPQQGLDFSPMVVLVGLYVLSMVIQRIF